MPRVVRHWISRILLRAVSAALALAVVLIATMVVTPAAQAQTFTTLYSFKGLPDGGFPNGLVLDTAGNLYGTTQAGGAHIRGRCSSWMRPAGRESGHLNTQIPAR